MKLGYDYMIHGSYNESLTYYENALSYFTTKQDQQKIAELYIAIAETYRNYDIPDKAIEYFLKGATLYEKLKAPEIVTSIYNSMTDLFMRQGDIQSAELYTKQAGDLLKATHDAKGLAEYYTNKGRIFNNYKEFDSAIYSYELASALFDSLKRYHDKGRALHNMANSLREKKEYAKAIRLCHEVLAIDEINENMKSRIFTILLLADIYNNMGNSAMGIRYGREGLKLAKQYHFKDRERVALLYLSTSYEQLGNFKEAHYYHKRYADLMDTIYDNTKYEQVAKMKTVYETEKKEKTIEIQKANLATKEATIALQENKTNQLLYGIGFAIILGVVVVIGYLGKEKQNRLLLKQKQEIEKQNQEREVLLKEIHHRVKNNLQVISSLLNMQSRKMEEGEGKMAVREGQSRIKSMSLIHQKLYSEDNLSRINMKEYIEELSDFLFKSYKPGNGVKRIIESENLLLDVDHAVPLGLIINELITNALKYAFDSQAEGQLKISLARTNEEFELKVADTGKGLPEDFENSGSMGMNLVHILVAQIDGRIRISREGGTLFTIQFKDTIAA